MPSVSPPLPLRPPSGVDIVLALERADLFLEGARKLLGVLPWFLEGPLRAALAAAPRLLGMGGLALLDPRSWKERGLAPEGGAGLWAFGARVVLLCAVSRRSVARDFLEGVLGAGKARLVQEGALTMAFSPDGKSASAHGFVGDFAWYSPDGSPEQLRDLSKRILEAPSSEESEIARRLSSISAPAHALRALVLDKEHVSLTIAPSAQELRLSVESPGNPKLTGVLGFLCQPREAGPVRLPRGALAVLGGLDLGEIVRGARRADGRGGAEDARGVGVLAVHEIDPALGGLLKRKATLHEILASGAVHGSLWGLPHDPGRWRTWLEEEVELEHGFIRGQGKATSYRIPLGKADAGIWLGLEEDALIAALDEADLGEARQAARGVGGRFSASIEDPETRDLLKRGEPFLYLRVADLADRLGGVVTSLWNEGSWKKGIGAREILQFLKRFEDLTLQLEVAPDAPLRASLRLRIR